MKRYGTPFPWSVSRVRLWDSLVMGEDRAWTAVREVVDLALADRDVVKNPPASEEEWGFFADSLADHIVANFKTQRRLL